jgi:hypothetical protein
MVPCVTNVVQSNPSVVRSSISSSALEFGIRYAALHITLCAANIDACPTPTNTRLLLLVFSS